MNKNIYTICYSLQKQTVHYYLSSRKDHGICNGFIHYSNKALQIMYPKTVYNPNYVYARNTYTYKDY